MADPYAGLGSPPSNSPNDPYAGLGTPPTQATRAPGATGLGALGQTVSDLFAPSGSVTHAPNAIESGIMGLANSKPIQGMVGAYQSADQQGFGGLVARGGEALNDVGIDAYGALSKIKQAYPGQSDQFYRDQLHQIYNQAQIGARQAAQQQVKDNQYPGSAVVNFPAAVLGSIDPSWLYNPGAGVGKALGLDVGKTAVSRIAGNIATHAVINSGLDDAYQAADMLTGVQKGYDLDRNLSAAAFGGAFGGVHAGLGEAAPHVTDFVKGLFSDRNIDTTPSENPLGRTTPITGAQPTPEVAQQIHQAWNSGNEQDIYNAYNGTNITPPSHAEIHEFVKNRDNPEANPVNPPAIGEVDQRAAVQSHVDNITQGWKNAPGVHVINHIGEIEDPYTLEKAVDQHADDPAALGFHDKDTGQSYIFANKVRSPEDVSAVLYHEGLGHFGLQQKFGANLDNLLQTLDTRNVGQFGKDVDAELRDNGNEYGGNRVRAAEEVLANMSEKGPLKPVLADAVESTLRRFGRKMGMNLTYSDAEVRNILAMAHDSVINGNGRNVMANNYKINRGYQPTDLSANATPTPLNHMFTGEKAAGFDPNNQTAYTAKDGQVRNEISDQNAYLKDMEPETTHKLGDVLQHPELFANYPELKNTKVIHTEMRPDLYAAYSPKTKNIYLNTTAPDKLSAVLHETQHAVQDIEDRPGIRGGNALNASADEYSHNALENEARAVEDRKDLTHFEREQAPVNFMRRKDAASADYVSQDLERIYRSLDEHYVPTTETHEETLNRALEAGFKPSQIKDLGKTSNLAVNLARMQSAANMADARLSALEDRIGTYAQKATDAMDYASALADFHYLNVRVKGTKADIARALNIAKTAKSYTVASMDQVAERLKAEGSGLADLVNDPIKFMKFVQIIKKLRAAGNPAGAHVLMAGVDKPYWEQYLTSFHFNAMLSSLSTHVKAPLDMMTGIGHNVIDHVLAMPIGKMYNFVEGITGQKVKPGVSAEEVQGRVLGALRSVFNHEVHMKTIEAAKTGDGSIVQPNSSSQPTNASATYGQASNARFTGLASPINIPMNLITAQDTFFRSVALGQELHGLGARQAIQDFKASGIKPTSDMIRVAGDAHAFNPTQSMLDEARGAAEKSLLLNPNKVTGWLGKMTSYTPGMSPTERIGTFLATNLAPFMRVASNSLITRTIERSPLPLLSPNTWKVLGEGGPQAHLALSRMIYGTVKLGLLWGAADAAKNALTGQGPQNTDKFKELEASGWRPNAVHENGQYNTGGTLNMSLNPFDLHNSTAQMVKDAHDAYDQAQKDNAGKGFFVASGNILKAALGTLYHDMEEGSWIHDMAPALNAADARGEGAGQTAASFAGQEAKTFVPGALNQATRLMDPNEHDTRPDNPGDFTGSVVNNVKSAIPGLAQTLPIRYSVYGDPLQNGASVTGVHTVIPGLQGNGVAETTDPTKLELQRLAQLSPAAVITPVQRTVQVTDPTTGDKKPMKLTTAQFEQYQQLAGVNIVDQVKQLMSSSDWAATPDKTKIAAVKEVEKQVKQAAREQLFGN